MDDFLKDIYTDVFKQWVMTQKNSKYISFIENDNKGVIIKTKYSYSEINFYDKNIIELTVTNTSTDELEFYLHFQMQNLHHALELFGEMLECIKRLVDRPVVPILLSCTSGLTTGFFAEKLNQVIKLLNLNYRVEAVSYNNVFKEGVNYKIVLLAPQISYMQAKIQEVLKHQIVDHIPSAIFAKYDVGEMIRYIQELLNKKEKEEFSNHSIASYKALKNLDCDILCISILRNSHRVHLMYTVYERGNQTPTNKEVIKSSINLQDIYDVIDIHLVRYSNIGIIGLSLPGIMKDGYISCDYIEGLEKQKLKILFEDKYHKKFVYSHNMAAAAMGYYSTMEKEANISMVFQPIYYYGEIGTVIDGKTYEGFHRISGQIQYLPLNLSDDYLELVKTPEGSIELFSKIIISLSVTLDPAKIVLCSQLITDLKAIKREVEKKLSTSCVPEIVTIEHLHTFMLLGQFVLCIQNNR